jgi:Rps23 Pro-64 3,4-dihydroxylase Tpa1-like proline 4-hydroxylase
MKVNNHYEPFDHLIVDDFLQPSEFNLVFAEVLILQTAMAGPSETGSSKDIIDGETFFRKSNVGIFLDSVYADRKYSNILKSFYKVFTEEFISKIDNKNWLYKKYLPQTNLDYTLLQSYGNGGYYKSHADEGLITAVTVLHKTPKEYSGGQLRFPEYDNYTVDLKNNQMIMFPAAISHEVLEVKRTNNNFDGNRFTVTKLISYNVSR